MLANVSILQALRVWSKLHDAYTSDCSIEVHGFELMPASQLNGDEQKKEWGFTAGSALNDLLSLFRAEHPDCVIEMNGMPYSTAPLCLDLPCRIEIIRHEDKS